MAQNPKYSYTQGDLMQPVFCTVCRQHIPKAISNTGNGVCPDCIASANAVAAAAAAQQAALQQQAQQALFNVQTGMGKCPQCQSTNIVDFENTEVTQAYAVVGWGCASILLSMLFFYIFYFVDGILLFIRLMVLSIGGIFLIAGCVRYLVGLMMIPKKKLESRRNCNYCGYRWSV